MSKKIITILVLLNIILIPVCSYSQSYSQENTCNIQEWKWASNIASEEYQLSTNLAYDQQNNMYIAGYFSNFLDLGDTILNVDGSAGYLAKYSTNGNLLWSRIEEDFMAQSFLIEGEKIYLSFSEISGTDVTGIAQYDLDGELQWTREFENGSAFAIATDYMGNSYVGGNFYSSIQFEDEILIAESEYGNGFVSKFSLNGEFIWARQISPSTIGDIAVNSEGEVYAAGTLDGTVNFGGDTLDLYGDSYGGAVLFKFSPHGDELSAVYVAKSPVYSSLHSIAIDNDDNTIVGGSFESTNTSEEDTATTKIGTDIYTLNSSFVAKYTKYNGVEGFLWSDTVTHGSQNSVSDIKIASNNNIYVAENNFVNHELSTYDALGYKKGNLLVTKIDGTYGTVLSIDLSPDDRFIGISGTYNQLTQFGTTTLAPEAPGNAYLAQLDLSTTLPSPQQPSLFIQVSEQRNNSVNLRWENGDGTGRLVLLKKLGKVSPSNIEDGIIYNSGTGVFGSGSQTGEREFVVYTGTGSEINITGLQKGRPYQVAVIEYNDSTICPKQINYLQEHVAKKIFVTSGGQGYFTAYPNPFGQGELTVQLPENISEEDFLILSNAAGIDIVKRKVKKLSLHENEVKVDLTSLNLSSGIYYLRLTGKAAIRIIKK